MRHDPVPAGAGSIPGSVLTEAVEAALGAVHHADPSDVIDGVLAALHDGLHGGFVSLFLLDHGRLWLIGMRGYAMIPDGVGYDEGIVGRAARTGESQLVLDVDADPDFISSAKGIVSELSVPIVGTAGVLGVLNVETTAALPVDADLRAAPLGPALVAAVETLSIARTLDLSALARLFVYTGSLREPEAIAGVTARSLARVIPLETCQLALLDDQRQHYADLAVWQSSSEAPAPLSSGALRALRERIDAAAVVELLDMRTMSIPELVASSVRTVAIVPLRASGAEIGLLVGTTGFPRAYDHRQAEAAALLGAHAAASIDAAVALRRERHSALTDSLTSLLNRRGFDETLEAAIDTAQAEHEPLTVLVLDCDDFKDVNDRAGHDFGDALLRELGLVLDRISGTAHAARLGGDEFAVMLPGVDVDDARQSAESLLEELLRGLAEEGFPVKLSGGTATYPYDGATPTQLKRTADQALYAAKGTGKSCIVTFRDVSQGVSRVELSAAERRALQRPDAAVLGDVLEAAATVWAAETSGVVLDRLVKALPFVLGSAGAVASRVEGDRVQEVASHALRDVSLGAEVAYLLDDFPLTREVVLSGESRAISFLDEDIDRAEAFVLRELEMTCCLLAPIHVGGEPWGLVEVYDQRHRRFTATEQAVVEFLAGHAARRIEALGDVEARRRRLPLFRLPEA